jgi:phosphate transport system substrate-binding protein
MKKTLLTACLLLMSGGAVYAQEKLMIGGSGGLLEEMTELSKAYMQKRPGETIDVIQDSMSTTGGFEGVKAGRFAIGIVTRAPRDSEKGKLVYRKVALTPVGIGVNKSMSVTNLTEAQVCDVFSGKAKAWKEVGGPEGAIMVLARAKDDNNTQVLREKMGCFKELKISAGAVMLVRGSEVMDAVDKRPGTVAVVNVASATGERDNIKVLNIDGNPATVDGVKSGKYKYVGEAGVVTLGEPQGLAKRFLEFVGGPDGEKILSQHKRIAVR